MAKKINIKGPIVGNSEVWIYEWFGIEATSPNSVSKVIDEANGEDLEVEINSGGGSIFAGSEIYTILKDYKGHVTVKIVGLAASAASVIAMAGNKVMMSPTAQMMIHNVSTYTSGDYRDMEHSAEVLKSANNTIANAYRLKTGKTQEELLKLMDNETWMTAQKAKELGFIDEIMFDEEQQLIANHGYSGLLPPEVINKMRNMLKNPNDKNNSDIFMQKIKSQLNLLKLKGEVYHE
ncbi:head maturation protease, ClpP-related [Tepidimicrobium xylanilyticum]|uniref:head maturation protease, ClpP-related n=1 Tax=Tepidimicrobium xylanilyticum TaxID=1123352 RepID=UPI002652901C|nr:head maturation protease, ClpP-related [Tepidimicrobium xylanilyticum]GMG96847.1 ATP-dependent Clp protease proteolytic subunit [Tepidimicrobium xylanilyticum]